MITEMQDGVKLQIHYELHHYAVKPYPHSYCSSNHMKLPKVIAYIKTNLAHPKKFYVN